MGDECRQIQERLGGADAFSRAAESDPRVAEHLRGCTDCKGFAAALVKVDDALFAELTPLAPPDFLNSVLAKVAAHRRMELAWARRRVATVAAAAVLLGALALGLGWGGETGASWGLLAGGSQPGEWSLSLEALERLRGALALVRQRTNLALGSASLQPPLALSWVLVVGLFPLLLGVNISLCRRWQSA
jgi:predicted anti-sigma-YlaC factor YlaD